MIISDLQHIESSTKIDVQGGCKRGCWRPQSGKKPKPPAISYYSSTYGTAEAEAQAFGTNTITTSTTTDTLVI